MTTILLHLLLNSYCCLLHDVTTELPAAQFYVQCSRRVVTVAKQIRCSKIQHFQCFFDSMMGTKVTL